MSEEDDIPDAEAFRLEQERVIAGGVTAAPLLAQEISPALDHCCDSPQIRSIEGGLLLTAQPVHLVFQLFCEAVEG